MASPVASSYSVAAGLPIYAGRVRSGFVGGAALARTVAGGVLTPNPSAFAAGAALGRTVAGGVMAGYVLPTYLAGKAIHEWVEIAGTAGANGAQVDPWGAFDITPAGRLLISCSGGHGDSPDNRVVSIDLTANSPSWIELEATSASFQENVRHYSPDNHPVSRHNYLNTFYVPALDKIFHVGAQAYYNLGGSWGNTDAYNVTARTWDPPNTYLPLPEGDGVQKGGIVFDGTHIWSNTLRKFNPATNTWTTGASGSRITNIVERPWAFDSARNQLFGVSWGTGTNNGGTQIHCARVPIGGTTEIACTINASTARDEFIAEAPADAGMDYDPINDRFLFYSGQTRPSGGGNATENRRGKVYVFTPTASPNAFDCSVLATSGPLPTAGVNAGINGRFKYVEALKMFVLLPQRTSNLWCFRVG